MTDVLIHYNNETGNWIYSIAPINDPSNWIESYTCKEAAYRYCKVNCYNIIKEVIDKYD